MYMRNSTRKNNSARSSQRGIRCGAPPPDDAAFPGRRPEPGSAWYPAAGASSGPGVGAGFAGNEGDVNSGCWDILWLCAPPDSRPSQAFATGRQTPDRLREAVLKRYHSTRRKPGTVVSWIKANAS
jgi:hypothetical protein